MNRLKKIFAYKGSSLKRELLLFVYAFILIASPFSVTRAQDVKASAKLKSEVIRIGEQTELTLKVNYDKEKVRSVQFPNLKDTIIGKVEIISKSEVEKYTPDKSNPSAIEQAQTYTITCFDSGYYAIPPLRFIIDNDTSKIAESEALLLGVNTVKADTTKAPKDIKPPLEEPITFADVLPYLLIGLGTLAAIVAIILFLTHLRKKPITIIPKAPPIPPHVLALRKLDELKDKKLWQEGKLKAYHSELSDILREYIEHTFPVNALELTSEEIFDRFRRINISRDIKAQLRQVLMLSDMVKFAKEVPLAEENELSMNNAVGFVKATMPTAQADENKENAGGNQNG